MNESQQIASYIRRVVGREMKIAGFKREKTYFARTAGELDQCVLIDRGGPRFSEGKFLDLSIYMRSTRIYEAAYLVPSLGIWDSQIVVSLAKLCNQDGWPFQTFDEGVEAVEGVLAAWKETGLPFVQSIQTDEDLIEALLTRNIALKSSKLLEWEIKVFRGEATRAERPKTDRDFYLSNDNFKMSGRSSKTNQEL